MRNQTIYVMRVWCAVVVLWCAAAAAVPCCVLARGGSRGLRLKALAPLGGVSLLARAVRLAHNVCRPVLVSTDHLLIAIEAKRNGASVHWRSAAGASGAASSAEGARELLAALPRARALLLLQLTSPFTRADQLRAALRALAGADCVFAVTSRSHKLRWQYTTQGRVRPLNLNPAARPRRQDWSGELLETGQFYLARTSLVRAGLLQNDNCSVVEVPAVYSLEVDTPDDLALANIMLDAYKYLN